MRRMGNRAQRLPAVAVAVALVVAACGTGDTVDGDSDAATGAPEPIATTAALASTSTIPADAVGDFGCDPTVIRDIPIREWVPSPSISSEEAVTAPELSPGRMRYLVDAGREVAIAHYGATEAELAAIDAYRVREAARPQMKKAARNATGNDWGGYWLEDVIVVVATAGDPTLVEDALAEFAFPIEIVPVSFPKADLLAWHRAIAAQMDDDSARIRSHGVSETSNSLNLTVVSGSTVDLTGIPCDALDLTIIGDAASAPWHEPDATPPPDQPWALEARPASVAFGEEVAYGPQSAPCAEVAVWSGAGWRNTGLAIKSVAWNSEATDIQVCLDVLVGGFSTLIVPDGTLPGWYRICMSDDTCALVEVSTD